MIFNMKHRYIYISIIIVLFLIIVLPQVISTQNNIGSTYVGLKEISNLYSSKLYYNYSRSEIIINNDENTLKINEDAYIGLKNNGKLVFLPSKIYNQESKLYAPIEIIEALEETSAIDEQIVDWHLDYDIHDPRIIKNQFEYITIDAGHGGKDPGAVYDNIYEKDIALIIAEKLKLKLLEYNPTLKIIMTRTDDNPLDSNKSNDLRMRTELASLNSKDGKGLFISIHVNATPIKERYEIVKGFETWYYSPYSSSNIKHEVSDYRKKWIKKVYSNLISNNSQTKQIITNIDKIIGKKSNLLARTLQNSLYDVIGKYTNSRGIKKAPYQILRESIIPAVLCEVGFLTNTQERKLLTNSNYQEIIAEGLAQGIIKYIDTEQAVLLD